MSVNYQDIGFEHYLAREYQAAIDNFTKALAISSGNKMTILMWRAECYAMIGQHHKAIEDYSALIEFDEMYYRPRSLSYAALEEYDSALRDINKAIEAAREDGGRWLADCLGSRGRIYVAMSMWREAIKDFSEAIAITDNIWFYYDRAQAYLKVNVLDKALEDIEQFLSVHPMVIAAQQIKASIKHAIGQSHTQM